LEPLAGSDYAQMLELCGCYHLRMAARVVTQRFDHALQSLWLRSTQVILLMAVGAADDPTISQLARRMGMDPSTLNRNLRPLTGQGLISLRSGSDGRSRLVALTDEGRRVVADAAPTCRAFHADLLDRFGEDRWRALLAELQDFIDLAREPEPPAAV
jgi:DNA-binding MarR family transcriptional regulator